MCVCVCEFQACLFAYMSQCQRFIMYLGMKSSMKRPERVPCHSHHSTRTASPTPHHLKRETSEALNGKAHPHPCSSILTSAISIVEVVMNILKHSASVS